MRYKYAYAMIKIVKEPCSNTAPRTLTALKSGRLCIGVTIRSRPHPLREGGLFLCVLINRCNDSHNQRQQSNNKPSKADHYRQSIFNLHRHHLLSGRLADRPFKSVPCTSSIIPKYAYIYLVSNGQGVYQSSYIVSAEYEPVSLFTQKSAAP